MNSFLGRNCAEALGAARAHRRSAASCKYSERQQLGALAIQNLTLILDAVERGML